MNDVTLFNRQLDLVKPDELDFPIAIIGAGGIGSWATLALAKMGCRDITVYDFDTVEAENTPSQFYKTSQIGMLKVDALRENVDEMTGVDISTISVNWRGIQADRQLTDKIVISAVDSMDERQNIWTLLTILMGRGTHYMTHYIDARMGGEFFNVNILDITSVDSIMAYSKSLYPESKVESEVCTAKSIVYNTFFIGGVIASVVKKIAKQQSLRHDYSFDIINMTAI